MRAHHAFMSGVASCIAGVVYGSFFVAPMWVMLLVTAGAIGMIAIFPGKKTLVAAALVCSWCVGAFSAVAAFDRFAPERLPEGEYAGIARIVSDPEAREFYQRIILRSERCEGNGVCPAADILWQAPLALSAEAGERVALTCALARPENFDPDFDYQMFLAKDGIGYVCEKASRADPYERKDMKGYAYAWLYRPKHALEDALARSIADPEASLGMGLILGGDRHLPERLQDLFTRIGLSHIVAVSGYNIALIAEGLLAFGIFSGFWRRTAVWVSLAGIILFVLMIGAPSSATRAAVMAGIAFLASQSGRLSRPVVTLVFAAALMLLINPLLFRYDVGFQLSFLATLAIILASSWERQFFPKDIPGLWLIETVWFSFVAELFVLPVILFQFHMFSPLMLLANAVILPLVPYAMLFSFLSAAAYLMLPGAHIVFSWIAYPILSAITRIPEALGALPWASLAVSGFEVSALALWYLALFSGIMTIEWYARKDYRAKAFSLPRPR